MKLDVKIALETEAHRGGGEHGGEGGRGGGGGGCESSSGGVGEGNGFNMEAVRWIERWW